MVRSEKAVSPLLSFVLVILISFTAISIVVMSVKRVIDRAFETMTVNEGLSNMDHLAATVRAVASEGPGSMRSIRLSASGGRYILRSDLNSLFFTYEAKSGVLQPKVFKKMGDVRIVTCRVPDGIGVDLKLNYNWANLTGANDTIGARGTNRLCIENVGPSGSKAVISVRSC